MSNFANYLQQKNQNAKFVKPPLSSQSLDAFLELKHTVVILQTEVGIIKEKKKKLVQERQNILEENKIMAQQWEIEVKKQWKMNRSSFPTPIEPLKGAVI